MTARTRTVWRVLADPPNNDALIVEEWYGRAAEAYLVARGFDERGYTGVEVNRCVLGAKVSRLSLLNRRGYLEDSDVVPVEVWKSEGGHSKRAKRGGKS